MANMDYNPAKATNKISIPDNYATQSAEANVNTVQIFSQVLICRASHLICPPQMLTLSTIPWIFFYDVHTLNCLIRSLTGFVISIFQPLFTPLGWIYSGISMRLCQRVCSTSEIYFCKWHPSIVQCHVAYICWFAHPFVRSTFGFHRTRSDLAVVYLQTRTTLIIARWNDIMLGLSQN